MTTPQDILRILDETCNFPNPQEEDFILTEGNCVENIIDPLENEGLPDEWTYECGVSKLCIIFKHLPFVIKIPFMGISDYDSFETERRVKTSALCKSLSKLTSKDYTDTFVPTNEITRFEGNNCPVRCKYDWDHCATEAYIFAKAQSAGLEECFAGETLLGEINNYPIYVQDKAESFSDAYENSHFRKSPQETYDKVFNIDGETPHCYINADWCANAMEVHGEELYKKLVSFLAENSINDLHDGNIGYIDDVPILFDYSGFYA